MAQEQFLVSSNSWPYIPNPIPSALLFVAFHIRAGNLMGCSASTGFTTDMESSLQVDESHIS